MIDVFLSFGGIMKELFLWMTIFIIVYLFYLFFIILRKKKLELFSNNTCYKYLVKVYHLNETNLNLKKMAHIIALANAFIIATTFIVIDFIVNFYLKMLVALITLLLLQLLTYHIIGTLLKRREKNV
ncbi:hypothetical protein EGP64_02230 [bacterium]|nr:hypothetical protein [bacterium]